METAPTELYTYCHTLSLPDALPISCALSRATPNPSSEEEGFDSIISTFALIPAIGARHGRQIRLSDRRDRRRRAHGRDRHRSEEHTSELQSLMRISYAVFCLKKKTQTAHTHNHPSPPLHTNL